mgnify:CR=1 FL=1
MNKEFEKLYSYSINILAKGPKTKNSMKKKLAERAKNISIDKDSSKELIETILNRLEEIGLINDMYYISKFVESSQSSKNKKYSKKTIYSKLLQRGISISELNEYFSKNPVDDIDAVKSLIEKKSKSLKKFSPDIAKKKLYEYLIRKGFRNDLIKSQIMLK